MVRKKKKKIKYGLQVLIAKDQVQCTLWALQDYNYKYISRLPPMCTLCLKFNGGE
jgi:hypothetical protein